MCPPITSSAKQADTRRVNAKPALMEGLEDPVNWEVQTIVYIGTAAKARRTFAVACTVSVRRVLQHACVDL
jgi:hypothetical protein